MKRTSIMLPSELKSRAERRALRRGISLGEPVRESLESALETSEVEKRREDPLFKDEARFGGDVPSDLAHRHDEYLYGPKRKR
ncbi:MAG: CopG family transcriptional regulator [Vicinamibacteria bacterium]